MCVTKTFIRETENWVDYAQKMENLCMYQQFCQLKCKYQIFLIFI